MIAVAEAFDAMTTDRVYRPALSQERAMAELFRCAGTQFDPILVRQFVEIARTATRDCTATGGRALAAGARSADGEFLLGLQLRAVAGRRRRRADASFQAKLLDNMYDAVVFVDARAASCCGTTGRNG